MLNEVKKLHKTLSWKRLEEFGLEYRFVAQYLQNKITNEEMVNKIQMESQHYAKRQMTWFKTRQKNSLGKKLQRSRKFNQNIRKIKPPLWRF